MTDNEIIKALECCLLTYGKKCEECPYEKHKPYVISIKTCSDKMRKDALDLINRQKAEIEKLEKVEHFADKTIATLQAEIDRLKEENKKQKVIMEEMTDLMFPLPFETDYDKAIKTAKAEAIKEFADRLMELKKERVIIWAEHIDNIVKEMVGDD